MPIKLNGSTSGFTQINAPAVAGSNTLTLPTSNGTNGQYLQTDGSGNLSFATITTPAQGQLQNQLFTASGTWTAPTGVTSVRVTVIAGGAGSFFNGVNNALGGGGGFAVGYYTVTPATPYTVTVGTGGVGVVSGTSGAGGASSFGSLISATGGGSASSGTSGAGGSGANGNITNSVSTSYYTTGPSIPYFRPIGGQPTSASFISSNSGSTAAIVWSVNYTTAANGAGFGGSNVAANGGVGGIVFVEWVG